jgi:hypothetical protein
MDRVLSSHWLWAVIIDFNCKDVPVNPIIQSRNRYYYSRNPGYVTIHCLQTWYVLHTYLLSLLLIIFLWRIITNTAAVRISVANLTPAQTLFENVSPKVSQLCPCSVFSLHNLKIRLCIERHGREGNTRQALGSNIDSETCCVLDSQIPE